MKRTEIWCGCGRPRVYRAVRRENVHARTPDERVYASSRELHGHVQIFKHGCAATGKCAPLAESARARSSLRGAARADASRLTQDDAHIYHREHVESRCTRSTLMSIYPTWHSTMCGEVADRLHGGGVARCGTGGGRVKTTPSGTIALQPRGGRSTAQAESSCGTPSRDGSAGPSRSTNLPGRWAPILVSRAEAYPSCSTGRFGR